MQSRTSRSEFEDMYFNVIEHVFDWQEEFDDDDNLLQVLNTIREYVIRTEYFDLCCLVRFANVPLS